MLAYCNSIAEAKRFRMVLRELGLAAWHVNGRTPSRSRDSVIAEFAGPLQKPVHVLVTVEVLGEGINIPNADTCMFVEPRNSYRSIIQAIGRVLRHHPAKTLAHIILPAVAVLSSRAASMSHAQGKHNSIQAEENVMQSTHGPGLTGQTGKLQDVKIEACKWTSEPEDEAIPRFAAISRSAFPTAAREINPEVQRDEGNDGKLHPKHVKGFRHMSGIGTSMARQGHAKLTTDFPGICVDQQAGKQMGSDVLGETEPVPPCVGSCDACCTYQKEFGRPVSARLHQTSHQKQVLASDSSREIVGEHSKEGAPSLQDENGWNSTKLKSHGVRSSRFGTSSESLQFGQQYGSELERFWAMLMLADHRLLGATVGHRIQIADCTLAEVGIDIIEELTADVYGRLSSILSRTDQWERRLQEVEAFAAKHGRLPFSKADDYSEKILGGWLKNQGSNVQMQRMPAHRAEKLLASSPLICRRARGWLTGDADGLFKENCKELRHYLRRHHQMPVQTRNDATARKLGQWLAKVRVRAALLSPNKIRMLHEVDPLVKAEVKRWQDTPQRVSRPKWEQRLRELSGFVSARGRLPKSSPGCTIERRLYNWLNSECRRLVAGHLPDDLQQLLQISHPLIEAHLVSFVQRHSCDPEQTVNKVEVAVDVTMWCAAGTTRVQG